MYQELATTQKPTNCGHQSLLDMCELLYWNHQEMLASEWQFTDANLSVDAH